MRRTEVQSQPPAVRYPRARRFEAGLPAYARAEPLLPQRPWNIRRQGNEALAEVRYAGLEPALRRALVVSGISTAAGLVLLLLLPDLMPIADSGFFLMLGSLFGGILDWLLDSSPVLLAVNLAGLVLYAALLIFTRGLRAGRAAWRWVAWGEIVIGGANGFVLALEVAILLANVLLWLVIISVALAIALAVLSGLGDG